MHNPIPVRPGMSPACQNSDATKARSCLNFMPELQARAGTGALKLSPELGFYCVYSLKCSRASFELSKRGRTYSIRH